MVNATCSSLPIEARFRQELLEIDELGLRGSKLAEYLNLVTDAVAQLKARSDEPSMRRVMHEASWTRVGQSLLRFEVRGSSFCHQQVRSMVGTLVDIGLGRLPADGVPAIFEALDRVAAGTVAPPEGLILWAVGYEGTRWDAAR